MASSRQRARPRRRGDDGFVEVRPNGRLLFRYDPVRQLVEVKQVGRPKEVVDLRKYECVRARTSE